jgi:hypothetical protein
MPLPRFKSTAHLLDTHEAMFGDAGRTIAGFVVKWAGKLFDEPVDPLTLRVLLAPDEYGGYNRHIGYAASGVGLILGNSHVSELDEESGIKLARSDDPRFADQYVEDFIVHELTHFRQVALLKQYGWKQDRRRGSHRDQGWFKAISEASPRYLGVSFPETLWPKRKSIAGRLTEVEACGWPHTFRELIGKHDARLAMTKADDGKGRQDARIEM